MSRLINNYTHRVNQRSRSLRLKVLPSGEVVVTTPPRIPNQVVEQFVAQHQPWIARVQAKLSAKLSFEDPATILLFGKSYQKKLIADHTQPLGVRILGDEVVINSWGSQDKAKKRLDDFFKNTATVYIINRTQQLAEQMTTTYRRISLKTQKSRWGSCSSQGNLNFNWRLVHYPTEIIDYVIIHELAHRSQMNHSAKFWQLVHKYDPAFQAHRRWLKKYGLTEG